MEGGVPQPQVRGGIPPAERKVIREWQRPSRPSCNQLQSKHIDGTRVLRRTGPCRSPLCSTHACNDPREAADPIALANQRVNTIRAVATPLVVASRTK